MVGFFSKRLRKFMNATRLNDRVFMAKIRELHLMCTLTVQATKLKPHLSSHE